MARGRQTGELDVTAMEMTKWFDTNYHYLVPELGPDTTFSLSATKPFDEHAEAMAEVGIDTVPVLIGPVSFLLLSKPADGVEEDFDPLTLLEPLIEVYGEVLERLAEQGATWVQLDEPIFVEDRSGPELDALRLAYEELASVHERPRLLVKTYFDHVGEAYGVLRDLPVEGIGLDFRSRESGHNVEFVAEQGGLTDKVLFAGIVDGRNVWINDLEHSLEMLGGLATHAGSSSSPPRARSFTPRSTSTPSPPVETPISTMRCARGWPSRCRRSARSPPSPMAWARGATRSASELEANDRALEDRRNSHRTRDPDVRARVEALTDADSRRDSPFEERREAQRERLDLPLLPTTTIGSYPQTDEIREARRQLREGEIDLASYEERMRSEVERVIRFQEDVGLDVLVHGEPERNDMVQYFGEQMLGYVFTQNAWVQSYGSRYVRPPIIFGDVSRPVPMTVEWITYAQALTEKPVKGMLTGPVTMLQWSFVRDDQPRSESCRQLALAIRDEVADLEAGGHRDHPGRRARDQGGPAASSRGRWEEYLSWAVESFRIPPRASATRPRSRPTCVTRTSATSSTRSSRWTRTST